MNGTYSSPHPISSGVPQGSILGPLLFLIFINDLPLRLSSPCLLYADDIKIWRQIRSTEDQTELQADLDRLLEWSVENSLPIHPRKSKVLNIRDKNPSIYYLGGSTLQTAQTERDLGTIISADLSISPNCRALASKARARLGLIGRTLGKLDKQSFSGIYALFVRPLLETNIQAASPYLRRHILCLESVQRRVTKMVRGLFKVPYPQRLSELNLFTLAYRRVRGDLILMYKIFHSATHVLRPLFQPNTSNLRGHPFKVYPQNCRLNVRKYSFALRACAPWNELPAEVVCSPNLETFKRGLDKLMSEGARPFSKLSPESVISPS